MGYSADDSMVRVDIWKQSGKWNTTVALHWDRYLSTKNDETELIHDTFRRCMKQQFPHFSGFKATCLEPNHEYAHPLMITL